MRFYISHGNINKTVLLSVEYYRIERIIVKFEFEFFAGHHYILDIVSRMHTV